MHIYKHQEHKKLSAVYAHTHTCNTASTQRLLAEPHLGLDASLFAVLVCDWPASVNKHTGSARRFKPVITTVIYIYINIY